MTRWLGQGIVAATLLFVCACQPASAPETTGAGSLLLPGLAAKQADIDTLKVSTAGNKPRVTVVRRAGQWRVAEREGWLADPVLMDSLLSSLADLRGAEAKTDDPKLYSRLGVEPIAAPQTRGVELAIEGAGAARRLLVGIDHPISRHTYVRVDGQARSWLSDRNLPVPRDPEEWLDHVLVEVASARIAGVEISSIDSPRFVIERAPVGFRMLTEGRDLPANTNQADALFGLLAPLTLQDIARDDGSRAERELHFHCVDGLVLDLQAWRRDGRIWLRMSASVDADRAAAWASQTGHGEPPGALQARANQLSQRGKAYVFLLPAYPSSILMLGREQLLAKAK